MNKMSSRDKFKNWLHYYKWYAVIGILLLIFLVRYIGGLLGFFRTRPDAGIAYVGKAPLSAEAAAAAEKAIGRLAEDYNRDGSVNVTLRQYLTANARSVPEAQQSAAASAYVLIGDINDCESYFFLTDDPAGLQLEWQILAMPDGSCPPARDFTWEDKAFPVSIPTDGLTEEEAAPLSGLYIGRRCFYTDKTCANIEQLRGLWERVRKELTISQHQVSNDL